MRFKVIFVSYSGLMGLVVGVVSALFLAFVNFAIHLIWISLPNAINAPQYYPLLVGLLGGLLVGWTQTKLGAYPKTMHETLTEFKQTQRVGYQQRIWKNFVAAVIVLAFGASLGPEAALASILGGLISWLGDRLKLTLAYKESLVSQSVGAMLAMIFKAPLMGISEPLADGLKLGHFRVKWQKLTLYALTTAVGIIGFSWTNRLFPKEQLFAIHLAKIQWQPQAFLMLVPAFLVGLLFGIGFLKSEQLVERLAQRIQSTRLKALLAGLCVGLMGMWSTYFLFSGEHALLDLTKQANQLSILALLGIAVGKVALTHICFAFGWRGGKIFPAIFASVAIGLVLTALVPYTPGLIIGVVVATSVTVILEQALVTAALLLFLLPLQFFPFILLSCLVAQWLVKTRHQHSV